MPSPWRVAKSLETLRSQINRASPNRSKISDGTIGDAAHASRSSDHNAWIKDGNMWVVSALDVTHDPAHGVDGRAIAQSILDARDSRVKYIISNGQIASGRNGPRPWVWRPYSGKNPHRHHVHISVLPEKKEYDSEDAWDHGVGENTAPPTPERNPVLRRGARGEDVRRLQTLLKISVDGDFGPKTELAVRLFQSKMRLVSDGVVGPATWEELE